MVCGVVPPARCSFLPASRGRLVSCSASGFGDKVCRTLLERCSDVNVRSCTLSLMSSSPPPPASFPLALMISLTWTGLRISLGSAD
eukprot:720164-Prymnesium_polylepis.2